MSQNHEFTTTQQESPRGNVDKLRSPSEFTKEPFPEHSAGLAFFRRCFEKSSSAGIIQRNLHLALESVLF